jgi:hypothetical protein
MDFTIFEYRELLKTLIEQDFSFLSLEGFIKNSTDKVILLRHDVDALPLNALRFARIQAENGVKGTYYFRIVPESFDEKIIKEVYSLGHEVGYHYEDISIVAEGQKIKVNTERRSSNFLILQDSMPMEKKLCSFAKESFLKNLTKLRELVPVKTICMHGSPMSRWDSRLLWKYYNYRDFDIIGEPYFDVNFNDVLYLTDTGRRWNGGNVSVRDKANDAKYTTGGINNFKDWTVQPVSGSLMNSTSESVVFQDYYEFKSTSEIIKAAKEVRLPDKIMMTFHPQRWTDSALPWAKELVWQNVKNAGKYFLIKVRN